MTHIPSDTNHLSDGNNVEATIAPELGQEIAKAADLIRHANRICVLTGAGISAESGIPTFRDKQTGLWEKYRPQDLASVYGFRKNSKLVWEWYQMRRRFIQNKKPNAAHYALSDMETWSSSQEKTFTLISQNVDNLHEQAGNNPLKIHGDISKNHCNACGLKSNEERIDVDDLWHCPECGGLMRPSVVWFGEKLPGAVWQEASTAAKKCDVFLSIGTSSQVYPAANLMRSAQKQGRASIVEINLAPSGRVFRGVTLAEKAGLVLPELMRQLYVEK